MRANYQITRIKATHPTLYSAWQNMKARCNQVKHHKYPRYGGRGIKVCEDWYTILGFSGWALSNGWKEGLTLDRKDADKGYYPENCRWISMSENSRNKRTTKITYLQAEDIRKRILSGENMHDLAREFNVVHGTIWFIHRRFTHVPDGECTEALKQRNIKNGKL